MRHNAPVLLSALAGLLTLASGLPQQPLGKWKQTSLMAKRLKVQVQLREAGNGGDLRVPPLAQSPQTSLAQTQLSPEFRTWLAALRAWLLAFPALPSQVLTPTSLQTTALALQTPTPVVAMDVTTIPSVTLTALQPLSQVPAPTTPDVDGPLQPLPVPPIDILGALPADDFRALPTDALGAVPQAPGFVQGFALPGAPAWPCRGRGCTL